MNPILIALLGVMTLPLFVGTWRTSVIGLSMQGLLLAWIAAHHGDGALESPHTWITLFDLAVVRGVLAPLALGRVLSQRGTPARHDIIPPNMLSWTLALGLVLVSFNSASALAPAGEARTLVAVALAGLLLGFLVLATQSGPFGQAVGVLRVENAIALFELGTAVELPLVLHVSLVLVTLATVAMLRWLLAALHAPAPDTADPELTL